MKLKNLTVLELKQILKEEFSLELNDKDIEKLAYSLVGYFDLLAKIDFRHRFGNSSSHHIDSDYKALLDSNRGDN